MRTVKEASKALYINIGPQNTQREAFEALLVTQSAICTLMANNIRGLIDSRLIPADLGRNLEAEFMAVVVNLQKCIKAQTLLDGVSRKCSNPDCEVCSDLPDPTPDGAPKGDNVVPFKKDLH
jgi:hypothetical protein